MDIQRTASHNNTSARRVELKRSYLDKKVVLDAKNLTPTRAGRGTGFLLVNVNREQSSAPRATLRLIPGAGVTLPKEV
jgi:hypothetical protein